MIATELTWSPLSSHDRHWAHMDRHWAHMIATELTWSLMRSHDHTVSVWGYHSNTVHAEGNSSHPHPHTNLSLPQIPPSGHQSDVSRLSPGGGRRCHCLEGSKEDSSHQEIPQGHLLGPPRLSHLWYLPFHNFSTDISQTNLIYPVSWSILVTASVPIDQGVLSECRSTHNSVVLLTWGTLILRGDVGRSSSTSHPLPLTFIHTHAPRDFWWTPGSCEDTYQLQTWGGSPCDHTPGCCHGNHLQGDQLLPQNEVEHHRDCGEHERVCVPLLPGKTL